MTEASEPTTAEEDKRRRAQHFLHEDDGACECGVKRCPVMLSIWDIDRLTQERESEQAAWQVIRAGLVENANEADRRLAKVTQELEGKLRDAGVRIRETLEANGDLRGEVQASHARVRELEVENEQLRDSLAFWEPEEGQ